MSVIVLSKDTKTPVASFQLMALAVADNLFLVLWFTHYSLRFVLRFTGASVPSALTYMRPNLHRMVSRTACIQDVLKVTVKVKGHVIRVLLSFCSVGTDVRSSAHVRCALFGADVDHLADRSHCFHALYGRLLAVPCATISQHRQSTAADHRRQHTVLRLQSAQVR